MIKKDKLASLIPKIERQRILGKNLLKRAEQYPSEWNQERVQYELEQVEQALGIKVISPMKVDILHLNSVFSRADIQAHKDRGEGSASKAGVSLTIDSCEENNLLNRVISWHEIAHFILLNTTNFEGLPIYNLLSQDFNATKLITIFTSTSPELFFINTLLENSIMEGFASWTSLLVLSEKISKYRISKREKNKVNKSYLDRLKIADGLQSTSIERNQKAQQCLQQLWRKYKSKLESIHARLISNHGKTDSISRLEVIEATLELTDLTRTLVNYVASTEQLYLTQAYGVMRISEISEQIGDRSPEAIISHIIDNSFFDFDHQLD